MYSFANQVAVVTGSAAGLGLGIARRLVAEGCEHVFGLDVNPPAVPLDGGVRHMRVDVSDSLAVERAIAAILAEVETIDVLVCNAAIMQPLSSVVVVSDDTLSRVMGVNFNGVVHCCRAVGRHMQAMKKGRIITMSSQVAEAPWPGMTIYAASKAAIIAFTRGLALELAPFGVYTNCIVPGTMDTNQMRQSFKALGAASGSDPQSLIAAKAAGMPLGRMGTPEDAANMVVWLASGEASFSVGGVFDLTGGELWSRSH